MNEHGYAVILAGGKGERFWPLSTSRRPKQVLSLFGGRTLLSLAIDRMRELVPAQRIVVITSKDLVRITQQAAPELPPENVIGEPVGRDTAAACALGMALVRQRDPDGVFCVVTADHIIPETKLFVEAIRAGMEKAITEDVLITIGIEPRFASTGYGYVETGDPVASIRQTEFLAAVRFVEKPDQGTAEEYLKTGRFFWNAGMFIWSVRSLQAALQEHCPELAALADVMGTTDEATFDQTLADEYSKLKRISVDYALMEKADNILMIRGTFKWDDVGAWSSLAAHFPQDAAGNVAIGESVPLESSGNIVVSEGRLTALVGVEDLVVVQAEDATLICHKDHAQDVKQLVRYLAETGRKEYL